MNVGKISYSSSIALSQAGSHVQTQKTASPTAAMIMLKQVPGFSSLNSLMQDSYHRLVFKDICYPWFSNTHAGFQIHTLSVKQVLNVFLKQVWIVLHTNILPEEERKMFGLEHTCAPFAFGNLIWKEQICALTEFTDKPLRLTELQNRRVDLI